LRGYGGSSYLDGEILAFSEEETMRTRLVIGFAAAALGVSALACTSPANPYAQVSEYCAAYAKAICQAGCQFDPTACQTYQSDLCNTQAQTETSSGVRQYQPGNVQPCLDAANQAYDNAAQVNDAQFENVNSVCARVFVGAAGEGAACTSDFDCAVNGDICATAPGVATQTCAKPTPKQVGDDCADRGDQCAPNSYCAPQTGTSVCVASQTAGQGCSDTIKCNSANQCLDSICQPLATQGQSCRTDTDCVGGLFCDLYTDPEALTPTCVSAYSFARGSVDCLGIEGLSTGGVAPEDAGTGSAGDAGSGGEAGSASDAASGG
jgi:hypothetical protein